MVSMPFTKTLFFFSFMRNVLIEFGQYNLDAEVIQILKFHIHQTIEVYLVWSVCASMV